MKVDVFNAVVARNAARALRLPNHAMHAPSVSSTTRTTTVDVATSVYGTSSNAQEAIAPPRALSHWRALATLHSLPTVFFVGGLDAAIPDPIHLRVQQYLERSSIQRAGQRGESVGSHFYPDCGLIYVDWGKPLTDAVSVFADENTSQLVSGEWRNAPIAFNCVELVEERDARAQRLLAELQNGAAHGRQSTERLRELQDAANEEGEPFSLDALEGLVMFANANPRMPVPELTLSGTGGVVAEWRRAKLSVTLYFATPLSVQYLVKRRNPLHPELTERSSGTTSVDRVGETLENLLSPSAWPIRA